jgi:hypothetical protein
MGGQPAVGHEVEDRHVPAEDGDVGDQPPVAPPPDALAAHHGDGRRVRLVEDLVQGGGELRRPGVGGVGGELGDGPPVVGHRVPGRQAPPPAQPLVPPVADADGRQPRLERLAAHVGVRAAPGEAADVDQ